MKAHMFPFYLLSSARSLIILLIVLLTISFFPLIVLFPQSIRTYVVFNSFLCFSLSYCLHIYPICPTLRSARQFFSNPSFLFNSCFFFPIPKSIVTMLAITHANSSAPTHFQLLLTLLLLLSLLLPLTLLPPAMYTWLCLVQVLPQVCSNTRSRRKYCLKLHGKKPSINCKP